jgi:hypothetical protein
MHSLKCQQEEADASWVEKQFDVSWKNADTPLQVSEL